MPEFVDVAAIADVPPGNAKAYSVKGREIALFNIEGEFYALDNYCPHQGGPLAEGYIEGATVTCPWHAWCFDVRTGTMTLSSLALVDVFDVRVDGERVLIATEPRP